jgi:hypothetical protein
MRISNDEVENRMPLKKHRESFGLKLIRSNDRGFATEELSRIRERESNGTGHA